MSCSKPSIPALQKTVGAAHWEIVVIAGNELVIISLNADHSLVEHL